MKKHIIVISLILTLCLGAFAAITDFTEYLPLSQRTGKNVELWNAIMALFVQKSGDTLTGDLGVTGGNVKLNTISKRLYIKEGAVGAQGALGTINLTGGSVVYTNTGVTATTRVFLSRVTGNAIGTTIYSTNQVGVGVAVIGNETNTFNVLLVEGQ